MLPKFWITTSWDDGSPHDERLAVLLKKYSIPATFYVPVKNYERKFLNASQIKAIANHFEIGCHTFSHLDLTKISSSDARKEIIDSKIYLESIIGRDVKCFCYPQGKLNKAVIRIVSSMGFEYARTTALWGTTVSDLLIAPTTIHAYNHNPLIYLKYGFNNKLYYFLLKRNALKDWENFAKLSLDWIIKNGGIYHLWGHSWEIDKYNQWGKLENVLAYIAKKTSTINRIVNSKICQIVDEQKKEAYLSIDPEKEFKINNTFFKREYFYLEQILKKYDKSGFRVLDIGCGIGRVSSLFTYSSYLGLDYIQAYINYANAKYTEKNKKFLRGDFENVNTLVKGKFDVILIWGLFEDERQPLHKLNNLISKLRSKDSIIIFSLFNINNPFNLIYKIPALIKFKYPRVLHNRNLLETDLKEFCLKNNFRFSIKGLGFFPPSIQIKLPRKIISYLDNFGIEFVVILEKNNIIK